MLTRRSPSSTRKRRAGQWVAPAVWNAAVHDSASRRGELQGLRAHHDAEGLLHAGRDRECHRLHCIRRGGLRTGRSSRSTVPEHLRRVQGSSDARALYDPARSPSLSTPPRSSAADGIGSSPPAAGRPRWRSDVEPSASRELARRRGSKRCCLGRLAASAPCRRPLTLPGATRAAPVEWFIGPPTSSTAQLRGAPTRKAARVMSVQD